MIITLQIQLLQIAWQQQKALYRSYMQHVIA